MSVDPPPLRIRDEPAPEWVTLSPGIRARVMVEASGSSITLYRIEAGRRFEVHHHPYPELGVILAGRGRVRIGDDTRNLREGDSYYFPAGIVHSFEVDPSGPVVLIDVSAPLPPDVAGPSSEEVLRQAKRVAHKDSAPSGARE